MKHVFQKKSRGKDGQSSFLDSPTMRNVLSGLCFYDHATDAQEPYCLARTHHRTGGEGGREGGRQTEAERKKERKRERGSSPCLCVCLFCPSRNYLDYSTIFQAACLFQITNHGVQPPLSDKPLKRILWYSCSAVRSVAQNEVYYGDLLFLSQQQKQEYHVWPMWSTRCVQDLITLNRTPWEFHVK